MQIPPFFFYLLYDSTFSKKAQTFYPCTLLNFVTSRIIASKRMSKGATA
ncbi:hypothetical protein D927_01095 [Enterococcus faecalis 02-MB-BW-10]|nr:hypothetical protein D927_01095 [Enterococcus faecalis 02-MB-BW-10]